MATDLMTSATEANMPDRLAQYTVPLATGVGGALTSLAGSVAQTADAAAGQVSQVGGSNVAWAGTAIAVVSLAVQGYLMAMAARRKSRSDDAAAKLADDTREFETWGGKYNAEIVLRSKAEARLEVVEAENRELKTEVDKLRRENREMIGKLMQMEAAVSSLTASLDEYKHKQDRADAKQEKVVEVVKKTAKKVQAIEHNVNTLSGDDIPTDPSKLPS
jgi:cell division protein FtsB